jgi:DNA-binding response OmpR family regulator
VAPVSSYPSHARPSSPQRKNVTRVLVIDDDASIRQVIAYALADEGYQVDEASDGQAALDLVEHRHPDIILLDMKMPGMDGWQFARLYRERYGHQAPIIVLTAAQDASQRGWDVNAEGYVSKPFEIEVLVARVSAISKAL